MNSQPHTHRLEIRDRDKYWSITYGDQRDYPDKPFFRDPKKVLASAINKLIAKHDRESLKAGAGTIDIYTIAQQLQPRDPTVWGSKQ